jgi:hypothetical protein
MGQREHLARLAGVLDQVALELRLIADGEGNRFRDELIVGLGATLGLGPTWAAAQHLALVLQGVADPPDGCADLVALLRTHRAPSSARQVLRILQDAAKAQAADKLDAFCQFRGFRDYDDSATDTDE